MIPQGCESQCRACPHREWSVGESLKQKYDFLTRKFGRWSSVLAPMTWAEPRWSYREQAKLRVSAKLRAGEGATRYEFGLGTDERFVAIPECPIHSSHVREVLHRLSDSLVGINGLPLFGVWIQRDQLVLILRTREMPTALLGWDPSALGVRGVWVHLNPQAARSAVLGKNWKLIWGEPRSHYSARGRDWIYGPRSFSQVHPIASQALDHALHFFQTSGDSRASVLDLYSGIGITLSEWMRAGASACGVELSPEAVACAKENAPGSEVYLGRVEDRLPQLRDWRKAQVGTARWLYANPSRLGLDPRVRRWLVEEDQPQCLAYLSCAPGTLARDLEDLERGGYEVQKLVPFDFFPQTLQVEVLALLKKRSPAPT